MNTDMALDTLIQQVSENVGWGALLLQEMSACKQDGCEVTDFTTSAGHLVFL